MKFKPYIFFVAAFLCAAAAFAGGTAIDSEVDAILDQEPELADFIRSGLEYCQASWYAAVRIAGNYPLGGKRLGPYERRVRPKGSKSNFDFVLTINTSYAGYDSDGKKVDVIKATTVDERMTSINLRYELCVENWCKASQQEKNDGIGGRTKATD